MKTGFVALVGSPNAGKSTLLNILGGLDDATSGQLFVNGEDITKYSNDMIGKTYSVLVEGVSETDKEMLSGYTEQNKLIHFKGDVSLIGKIVNVKVLESHTYSMIGELVND